MVSCHFGISCRPIGFSEGTLWPVMCLLNIYDSLCAPLRRALVAVLPESEHTAVLEKLCADLASDLEQLDGDIEDHIPSIMQALSSIGRIAPEIFAEHAKTVADFVLDVRSVIA